MDDVQHIILTRFNVRQPWMSRYSPEGSHLNPEWLQTRIELFERFPLPSILRQTVKSFRWLVFFDAASPEFLKSKIAEWQTLCPQFIPIYSSEYNSDFVIDTLYELLNNLPNPPAKVITNRFDSDDMLGRRFIETVQSLARTHDFAFINAVHGYQYCNGKLYRASQSKNAFVGLTEPLSDRLKTVFCTKHGAVDKVGPVVDIETGRHWLQNVHGGNMANAIEDPTTRCPLSFATSQFPIWTGVPQRYRISCLFNEFIFTAFWGAKFVVSKIVKQRK